ncbi:glycosyltransferase [Rhodococcoides fascians]|uniref:glycosyltransferase n=1 Tax=Rhodococcoides fascians TaxID=1828 RepID=UPI0005637525|nr:MULTISPECIES: glycosyltransferase [Rhodococcus]OZF01211.1 glycosyl transferase [Rhodococcus sp. 15-1189-1-1a]OZF15383.1 glycosyl transferase [Rhodococcus sp. 14-2686-1-2]
MSHADSTTTTEAESVDLPSSTELRAQRLLFDGPSPLVSADMYTTVAKGNVERSRYAAKLAKRTVLETNSYFGRFPASYWQRWTDVTEVRFSASVAGSGRIDIVATDYKGRKRTMASETLTTDGRARRLDFAVPVKQFLDGGALFARFTTTSGELTVEDAEWTVDAPEKLRPTSVVICTFNRADDCANTVAAMADDPIALLGVDNVYVVDQGTDQVQTRPLFQRVAAELGDKLVYITQPNLGGAGGFTRGLYEVQGKGGDPANVVFMDDDVLCEPEAIVRMNAFANKTIEPAIIGAQMLYLLHPDRVHVGAEVANLQKLEAGLHVKNAISDKSALKKKQEIRVDAGYNGWWSCLIPSEIVSQIGYPLPLFFQWDDIEYGYRARANGFATVTLPGAAVWHADFAWKDWDEWHRYFNLRNGMITASLHAGLDGKKLARQLTTDLFRYLVSMQYGMAFTLIKAIEDFLVGPSKLTDGGMDAAAAIRRDRAAYNETKRYNANSVPDVRPADMFITPAGPHPKKSLEWAVLAKRVLNQSRGRVHPGPVAISADDAHWWHVSLFAHAVVTDRSQEGVRVRKRDKAAASELLKRGLTALRRLRVETDSVAESYRQAVPELTSRENWTRLYS